MESNKNLLLLSTLIILVPIIGFIALMVIWATKKDELKGADREYLKNLANFELLMFLICLIVGIVLAPISFLVGVFNLVIIILATVSILNGQTFKFPFNVELLK